MGGKLGVGERCGPFLAGKSKRPVQEQDRGGNCSRPTRSIQRALATKRASEGRDGSGGTGERHAGQDLAAVLSFTGADARRQTIGAVPMRAAARIANSVLGARVVCSLLGIVVLHMNG